MHASLIFATTTVGLALGLLPLSPVSAQAASPHSVAQPAGDATDLSARHRAHRYQVRSGPRRYRVAHYRAERPFKYHYGPGYRLYFGHPNHYGPTALMWPYSTAPYPRTTFGFGSW